MTDIDNLPAGPEMNALVAEKVMGWHDEGGYWCNSDGEQNGRTSHANLLNGVRYEAWSPSSDVAAAWEVVKRIQDSGWGITLHKHPNHPNDIWECWFFLLAEDLNYNGDGSTAPLAICRAALKAIERQTERVEDSPL